MFQEAQNNFFFNVVGYWHVAKLLVSPYVYMMCINFITKQDVVSHSRVILFCKWTRCTILEICNFVIEVKLFLSKLSCKFLSLDIWQCWWLPSCVSPLQIFLKYHSYWLNSFPSASIPFSVLRMANPHAKELKPKTGREDGRGSHLTSDPLVVKKKGKLFFNFETIQHVLCYT